MIKAVFPGSFDPPTNGHLNIIKRASVLFDQVDVVIAINIEKKSLFSAEEKLNLLMEMVLPLKNVKITTWNGLITDYAKNNDAKVLVRGVRNGIDFDYEFELARINKKLYPELETIFIPTENDLSICKSSTVKELAQYGSDVSEMVPENVNTALKKIFDSERN